MKQNSNITPQTLGSEPQTCGLSTLGSEPKPWALNLKLVQDPKNMMDWDAKDVRMYKKAKRERRTEQVMRARYDQEVMRAKDES